MYSDDDIQYALETTEILLEPDRRIDTFGSTCFQFHLISQLMDSVSRVRIRSGKIEAERPRIIAPQAMGGVQFEGWGEQAEDFLTWLRRHGGNLAVLRYGFSFRKSEVREQLIHDQLEGVRARLLEDVRTANNPLDAVLEGVDDAWEICLLRFTMDMIQKSHGINVFDFKRRGLL
jgi:hypothetical protein